MEPYLTIFVGIIALANLILLAGLGVLALSVKKLVNQNVKPVVGEVHATIQSVHSVVDKVEDKAENILDISEKTARKLSGTVTATGEMVKQSVTNPLISFSSMVAGVTEAIRTLQRASGCEGSTTIRAGSERRRDDGS